MLRRGLTEAGAIVPNHYWCGGLKAMIAEETAELSVSGAVKRLEPVSIVIKLALDQLRDKALDINYDEDWQAVHQRTSKGVRHTVRLPSASGLNAEKLASAIFSADKALVLCIIASNPAVVVVKLLSYMAGLKLQKKSLVKLTVEQWLKLIEAITKLQSVNLLMACDRGWRVEDYDVALTELTNVHGKQRREAIAENMTFSDTGLLIVATRPK